MTVTDHRVGLQDRRASSETSSRYFAARTIDDAPELLEMSYALRYQVYCLERKFLRAEDYPRQLEIDAFDSHAIHVGALDAAGALAGTARLVTMGEAGLPLFAHCSVFPHEAAVPGSGVSLVEVSRLCVSRAYNRRAVERRTGGGDVFLTISKGLYQASKRIGATHWLAATDEALQRMLAQFGFPFRRIGPESDYFGPVFPYRMDLGEFDDVILSNRFPVLRDFVAGLEPEFRPRARHAGSASPVSSGSDPEPTSEAERLLLAAFHRAASEVPGYRMLLAEQGVRSAEVLDVTAFSRSCPVTSKSNTFNRFPLDQLSVGGELGDLADVMTSSGHGGRFSFGVMSRRQAAASADFIDEAFDVAFQVKSRRTLVINCLPMGVVFSSRRMTVATTSVREDMAVALVLTFGHHYEQIVLMGDPLFLKRLTDHAAERGVDWSRYRVHAIVGEEIFGEHFRGYLARCLGLNSDQPNDGFIMSSFGVGELGLHLCYETPSTVALRRAAFRDPLFAQELLGAAEEDGMALPMIFTFNPLRTFIEVVGSDAHGYGQMTTSMLDPDRPVPLLRYQTGDIVRLLDPAAVSQIIRRYGVVLPGELPSALLALRGREREALPNGSHVGFYKDALYTEPQIAGLLTGAFRLVFSGSSCTMHVQLAPSQASYPSVDRAILQAMPPRLRPTRLVIWPYGAFPFGMSLDYERKFTHYVPGELNPAADLLENVDAVAALEA